MKCKLLNSIIKYLSFDLFHKFYIICHINYHERDDEIFAKYTYLYDIIINKLN